jgi:hypothetical protein
VATQPGALPFSGRYFSDCNPARPSRHGRDAELARRLWSESERIATQLG